jgi:ABC-type transporter Mla subunit MlaD
MAKMVDNNSKALIQALQEVIHDFNNKISEQFGENFKKLNEAVGQLLVWQETYRNQLSEMITQQTKTTQNMEIVANRYEDVVSKAEAFGTISMQLATVLTELSSQRNQIEQSLTSLAQLLTTASGSLPQIENRIMELTQQMTFGVKANQEETTKAIRNSSVALQNTMDDIKKLMLEATQMTNQEINSHVKQMSDKTNEQIVKLDQALERELSNSITSLGRQLTSLSRRFVEDYTPLTESLRELVKSVGGR